MSLINPKYEKLKPKLVCLSSEVVLAQAWKKTHSYIRYVNWYADSLELDCSAINIEKNIANWAKDLDKNSVYMPAEMMVVPAPKMDNWGFHFKEDWTWGPKPSKAKSKKKSKDLRPLAHLSIKDQTIATAVMLCLADVVETAQHSTKTEFENVHEDKVFSYGNRLFCDWVDGEAHFRWGNSTIYSKYYDDYQKFLSRPIWFASRENKIAGHEDIIYEIDLDLSGFYDCICLKKLQKILKSLCEKKDTSNVFWNKLKQIFSWEWDSNSDEYKSVFKNKKLPQGLPQGLVASGFFANAYMLDFDQCVGDLIGKFNDGYEIIDYCRYVDDIKLVVIGKNSCNKNEITEKIVRKLENYLPSNDDSNVPNLKFNEEKTKIFEFTSKRSDISRRMKNIQNQISGPANPKLLSELLNSLDGLFTLAEQFQIKETYEGCDIELSAIDSPRMDVREDTILRFVANRLTKMLTTQRSLTPLQKNDKGVLIPTGLDYMYETIARRFIASWARNPALLLLFKKGFELFPHPNLLNPVWKALKELIKSNSLKKKMIAWYCFAELFRMTTFQIFPQKEELLPIHSDKEKFLDLVHEYGMQLSKKEYNAPWFTLQQIYLFFAVSGFSATFLTQKNDLDSLANFNSLHKIIRNFRNIPCQDRKTIDIQLPLFLIAHQLVKDKAPFLSCFANWILKMKKPYKNHVFRTLAIEHPHLLIELYDYIKNVDDFRFKVNLYSTMKKFGLDVKPLKADLAVYNKRYIPLLSIILRPDNPFAHENALLKLLNAVLTCSHKIEFQFLHPFNVKIRSDNWDSIQNPSSKHLKIEVGTSEVYQDLIPNWIKKKNRIFYRIGAFARSCVIGDIDFSAQKFMLREANDNCYYGLKTSWYKRCLGMANSPESLVGDTAPLSNWISELLFHLLQWPGLNLRNTQAEWPSKWTLNELSKLISEKLNSQSKLFGNASNLPIYIEKIKFPFRENTNCLKVVMVQPLLPKKDDFNKHGVLLNSFDYRVKHRAHIMNLTKLVFDKLNAFEQTTDDIVKNKLADIIIFPELSVHKNDLDILEVLARNTGAIIFAGLVFNELPGIKTPVNLAQWIIPWKDGTGIKWIKRVQGKKNMMAGEKKAKISPWRPYQLLIELENPINPKDKGFILTGSICFDATDLNLVSDLKNKSDAYLIPSLNQDVNTFDNMIDALHYHMYQHVILVNSGEFGGSVAKAPYKEPFRRLIAHSHGNGQIAISMFDLNIYDFGINLPDLESGFEKKTPPADFKR